MTYLKNSLRIALLIGIIISSRASARWERANGPLFGPTVYSLAVLGNDMFAGTDSGCYRSTDGGFTWRSDNQGLPSLPVLALATHGQNIFACTGEGIFLSSDEGESWVISDSQLVNVHSMLSTSSELFARAEENNIYRSSDEGTTWQLVFSDNAYPWFSSIVENDGRVFVGSASGIFSSSDNGTSWTGVDSSLQVSSLGVSDSGLIATTQLQGVFLSTDSGAKWESADSGLKSLNISQNGRFVTEGTDTYMGTGYGVYRSTDGGLIWTPIDSGLAVPGILSIIGSGQKLYASTANGIFVSSDSGQSWGLVGSGMKGSPVTNVAHLAGSQGFIAASIPYGVEISTDGGDTWTLAHVGMAMNTLVNDFAVDGNNIVAGTSTGVYLDKDAGSVWVTLNSGLPQGANCTAVTVGNGLLLAGLSDGAVFKSTDYGTSWAPADSGIEVGIFNAISGMTMIGKDIFAITQLHIYRSTDYAKSWTIISNSGGSAVAAHNGDLYVCGNDGVGSVSKDSGSTWIPINKGLTGSAQAYAFSEPFVFAGTASGICSSNDEGEDWTPVDSGISQLSIGTLAVNDDYLFAGSGTGLFRRPLAEITTAVIGPSFQRPDRFVLDQNYPNPFNPTTVIKYYLPTSANVVLRVFDILGRQVETLVDARQAAGTHSVRLNATNLASGVYFYRLEVGRYHATKKLLLLK